MPPFLIVAECCCCWSPFWAVGLNEVGPLLFALVLGSLIRMGWGCCCWSGTALTSLAENLGASLSRSGVPRLPEDANSVSVPWLYGEDGMPATNKTIGNYSTGFFNFLFVSSNWWAKESTTAHHPKAAIFWKQYCFRVVVGLATLHQRARLIHQKLIIILPISDENYDIALQTNATSKIDGIFTAGNP